MTIVVKITDETKSGSVAVTVLGENGRPSRAKRVFDLILPALEPEFKAVRSYLKNRKKLGIEEVRS